MPDYHIPYNPDRFREQMKTTFSGLDPRVAIPNYLKAIQKTKDFLWSVVLRGPSWYDSQTAQSVANGVDLVDAMGDQIKSQYNWDEIGKKYPALVKLIQKTVAGPTENPADKSHWKVSIAGALHQLGLLDSSVSKRFGLKIQKEREAISRGDLNDPNVSFVIRKKVAKMAHEGDQRIPPPLAQVITTKYKADGELKATPTLEASKEQKTNTGVIAAVAAIGAFILLNR